MIRGREYGDNRTVKDDREAKDTRCAVAYIWYLRDTGILTCIPFLFPRRHLTSVIAVLCRCDGICLGVLM